MGNLIEADTKQIAKAAENMMKSVTEIKNELSALAESMKAMDSKIGRASCRERVLAGV